MPKYRRNRYDDGHPKCIPAPQVTNYGKYYVYAMGIMWLIFFGIPWAIDTFL
jgi:hypothetical protein